MRETIEAHVDSPRACPAIPDRDDGARRRRKSSKHGMIGTSRPASVIHSVRIARRRTTSWASRESSTADGSGRRRTACSRHGLALASESPRRRSAGHQDVGQQTQSRGGLADRPRDLDQHAIFGAPHAPKPHHRRRAWLPNDGPGVDSFARPVMLASRSRRSATPRGPDAAVRARPDARLMRG